MGTGRRFPFCVREGSAGSGMDLFLHGGGDQDHGLRIRPAKDTTRRVEATDREREIAALQQYRDYEGHGKIISEIALCEYLRSPARSSEGHGLPPGFLQRNLIGGWQHHEHP